MGRQIIAHPFKGEEEDRQAEVEAMKINRSPDWWNGVNSMWCVAAGTILALKAERFAVIGSVIAVSSVFLAGYFIYRERNRIDPPE